MLNIEPPALDALAALLLERAGLKVGPDGYYALRLALKTRMPALGISDAREYVDRLKELAGEHELRSLLPLVTVGKTEFFRDSRQFHALEKRILPEMLRRARRDGRAMSIWSAGCATGEEPYSVAMLLAELGAHVPDVNLLATDINLAAIEQARAGRYGARRLAGLSEARIGRHFRPTEDGYEVSDQLKSLVRFDGFNLATAVFGHLTPGTLDLVLCRNVIIYFDLRTIRRLMDRFWEGLRPGGLLLLGYSESLFKVYERFEMVEVDGTFVYRRPTGERPAKKTPPPLYLPAVSVEPPRPRVTQPAKAPARTPPPTPLPLPVPTPAPGSAKGRTGDFSPGLGQPPSPAERLDAVVAQMDRGQFEEALAAVRRLTEDEPNALDALLTLGNLHGLLGHFAEARAAFQLALSREPLCVEARIFGGVAALQAQAFVEAQAEFTKALFLEPTLAVGHYLLAQTLERSRQADAARRSYRNALAQLKLPQRPLAGYYPDMPDTADALSRAARYALAALEEL